MGTIPVWIVSIEVVITTQSLPHPHRTCRTTKKLHHVLYTRDLDIWMAHMVCIYHNNKQYAQREIDKHTHSPVTFHSIQHPLVQVTRVEGTP